MPSRWRSQALRAVGLPIEPAEQGRTTAAAVQVVRADNLPKEHLLISCDANDLQNFTFVLGSDTEIKTYV